MFTGMRKEIIILPIRLETAIALVKAKDIMIANSYLANQIVKNFMIRFVMMAG